VVAAGFAGNLTIHKLSVLNNLSTSPLILLSAVKAAEQAGHVDVLDWLQTHDELVVHRNTFYKAIPRNIQHRRLEFLQFMHHVQAPRNVWVLALKEACQLNLVEFIPLL
jgi:hypothetical protein